MDELRSLLQCFDDEGNISEQIYALKAAESKFEGISLDDACEFLHLVLPFLTKDSLSTTIKVEVAQSLQSFHSAISPLSSQVPALFLLPVAQWVADVEDEEAQAQLVTCIHNLTEGIQGAFLEDEALQKLMAFVTQKLHGYSGEHMLQICFDILQVLALDPSSLCHWEFWQSIIDALHRIKGSGDLPETTISGATKCYGQLLFHLREQEVESPKRLMVRDSVVSSPGAGRVLTTITNTVESARFSSTKAKQPQASRPPLQLGGKENAFELFTPRRPRHRVALELFMSPAPAPAPLAAVPSGPIISPFAGPLCWPPKPLDVFVEAESPPASDPTEILPAPATPAPTPAPIAAPDVADPCPEAASSSSPVPDQSARPSIHAGCLGKRSREDDQEEEKEQCARARTPPPAFVDLGVCGYNPADDAMPPPAPAPVSHADAPPAPAPQPALHPEAAPQLAEAPQNEEVPPFFEDPQPEEAPPFFEAPRPEEAPFEAAAPEAPPAAVSPEPLSVSNVAILMDVEGAHGTQPQVPNPTETPAGTLPEVSAHASPETPADTPMDSPTARVAPSPLRPTASPGPRPPAATPPKGTPVSGRGSRPGSASPFRPFSPTFDLAGLHHDPSLDASRMEMDPEYRSMHAQCAELEDQVALARRDYEELQARYAEVGALSEARKEAIEKLGKNAEWYEGQIAELQKDALDRKMRYDGLHASASEKLALAQKDLMEMQTALAGAEAEAGRLTHELEVSLSTLNQLKEEMARVEARAEFAGQQLAYVKEQLQSFQESNERLQKMVQDKETKIHAATLRLAAAERALEDNQVITTTQLNTLRAELALAEAKVAERDAYLRTLQGKAVPMQTAELEIERQSIKSSLLNILLAHGVTDAPQDATPAQYADLVAQLLTQKKQMTVELMAYCEQLLAQNERPRA